MKKERKKGKIIATSVVIALCILLIIPYACQDKAGKLLPINEISEFFVNEDIAKTVAENFMQKTNPSLKSAQSYKLKKIRDDDGVELIYVVNFDEGGFVLMPTDNRVNPILAFSKTNSFKMDGFENVNGISLWMAERIKQIKNIKKMTTPQNKEMKELWKKHLTSFRLKDEGDPSGDPCVESHTTVGPLMTTIWHQRGNYNTDCPTATEVKAITDSCNCDFSVGGLNGHARAGCIPVAMGQIMNYHQYPNTYSWSQMPQGKTAFDYLGNSVVADLLSDIGDVLDVNYYCYVSEADLVDIVPAFENNYGYSTTATRSNYYSNFVTVRNNISNDWPVLFTGSNSSGYYHSWVCDGYQTSIYCIGDSQVEYNYLHMNWGDGVDYNPPDGYTGFYSYDDLGDFNNNLSIITGIKP